MHFSAVYLDWQECVWLLICLEVHDGYLNLSFFFISVFLNSVKLSSVMLTEDALASPFCEKPLLTKFPKWKCSQEKT